MRHSASMSFNNSKEFEYWLKIIPSSAGLICSWPNFAALVANYGISNTIVLEIPQFTTESATWSSLCLQMS